MTNFTVSNNTSLDNNNLLEVVAGNTVDPKTLYVLSFCPLAHINRFKSNSNFQICVNETSLSFSIESSIPRYAYSPIPSRVIKRNTDTTIFLIKLGKNFIPCFADFRLLI